jgi:DNA-binding transcriptional ArsR family regulator
MIAMPLNPNLIPRVVERLRAIADESRIRILMELKAGPANVTALSQRLEIAQPAVSKHLAVLKQTGLVDCRRMGTQCVYEISDKTIFELCALVCDGVVRHLKAEHAALEEVVLPFKKGKRK